MTSIRCGNYLSKFKLILAYINIGKKTFRDNLKFFNSTNNNTLKLERVQRRYDTFFKRFTKYERNTLSFNYLDENNKQVGGKLKVDTQEINLSMLRAFNYQQFGYFTSDKLVFARFNTE